jgi:hypothetical protein
MADGRFSFQQLRMNAGLPPRPPSPRRRLLFDLTIFGVAFCIALLYQAMRPIMRLGGMVASGGPYAIEHPAPSWVWIMPVAIMLGMACFFVNLFAGDADSVNLMPLAWPGLFLSLGWNFLEFAFNPPGGGFAWGWLVCGVVFALMGGLPLLLAFKPMRARLAARRQAGEGPAPFVRQWLLVGAGIVAAIYVFRAVVS